MEFLIFIGCLIVFAAISKLCDLLSEGLSH
jgi:hypothetical protein